MITKKNAAVVVASSGAGLAQTFILREYVDKAYGKIPGLDGLGGFGTYSAMGGIIAGGITTGLGLVSVLTGKITRNETIQLGFIGYGVPALSGGILSGLFPVTVTPAPPGGRLRAPAGLARGAIQLKSAGINRGAQGARVGAGQTGAIPLRT